MRFRLVLLSALAFSACGGSPGPPAGDPTAPAFASARHELRARVDCSTRSQADFPGAFADPQNLVAGPLVMIGAARFTDARTVRRFGGNKFPLLVKAGHTATVQLAADDGASLTYGGLPEAKAFHSITFAACGPGRSASHADGAEVTFWSGFVRTREPACLALRISIDGGPPRRMPLSLGVRC
jgi:hypothetical protein